MNGAVPYYKFRTSKTHENASPATGVQKRPEPTRALLCEMAHRVNNLLMRIQGWTSLRLLDVEEDNTAFNRLKLIEKYIGHGAVLTSQLLAYAGRGVYADPVNIPPLLLESSAETDAGFGDYDIKMNLFVVDEGQLQPDLLDVCRSLAGRITRLFNGIESFAMIEINSELEAHYSRKVRRVTGEGLRIMRSVSTGTINAQTPFFHRYLDRVTIAGTGVPAQLAGRY